MTIPATGKISSHFNEMRPLSAKKEYRTHVHGAIDVAASVNTPIYAPEKGVLYYIQNIRHNKHDSWHELEWRDGQKFPFQNYFYDLYGSLILLVGQKTGYFHIFCHSWWSQLYKNYPFSKEGIEYQEESMIERFPIQSYHNLNNPIFIEEGERIGLVGNAGYSTGSHIHYEIHDGKFQKYEDRIDPEFIYKGAL